MTTTPATIHTRAFLKRKKPNSRSKEISYKHTHETAAWYIKTKTMAIRKAEEKKLSSK